MKPEDKDKKKKQSQLEKEMYAFLNVMLRNMTNEIIKELNEELKR